MKNTACTNFTAPTGKLPKSREITRARKIKIMQDVLDGKTLTQAALDAGYAKSTANKQPPNLIRNVGKESFKQILAAQGLTDNFLATKIKSLISAQNTHFFSRTNPQNNEFEIVERKSDALETQRKTTELACKLAGHLKDQDATIINNAGLMQIVVSQLTQSQ